METDEHPAQDSSKRVRVSAVHGSAARMPSPQPLSAPHEVSGMGIVSSAVTGPALSAAGAGAPATPPATPPAVPATLSRCSSAPGSVGGSAPAGIVAADTLGPNGLQPSPWCPIQPQTGGSSALMRLSPNRLADVVRLFLSRKVKQTAKTWGMADLAASLPSSPTLSNLSSARHSPEPESCFSNMQLGKEQDEEESATQASQEMSEPGSPGVELLRHMAAGEPPIIQSFKQLCV